MDYSKVKYIDEFDMSNIANLPDYQERLQLIKSYLGQWNYLVAKAIPRSERRIETNRRVKRPQDKCIEHYQNLAQGWMDKINLCLAGAPLNEVKGKVKVATSMPPSTHHSARYHIHQERLAKKRARRKMKKNNDGKE